MELPAEEVDDYLLIDWTLARIRKAREGKGEEHGSDA